MASRVGFPLCLTQYAAGSLRSVKRERTSAATSAEIVRRILHREAGSSGQVITAEALQRACTRVCENLSDSLGEDGCTALLARSLARTEEAHPALKIVRHANGRGITLDGVAASIDKYGIEVVTPAIEALLAALVDVLGRLIGEDMAERLFDQTVPRPRRGDGGQAQ
jgi:hypothetical protein